MKRRPDSPRESFPATARRRPDRRSMSVARSAAAIAVGALLVSQLALGQAQSLTVSRTKVTPDPEQEQRLPRPLRDLGWDQKMGDEIPLDLEFVDHEGSVVRLGDFFGERPVLIAPVYYDCPMLCSLVLDGVVRGVKPLKFLPGEEYDIVAVSFDPTEGPADAARSRRTSLARFGGEKDSGGGWHFLTGDEARISLLMDAIGFKYQWDEETEQYAHAGGIVVATPEGRISRYFYGVDFASKDLRLGFVEASAGKIGNVVDQVLLFCYQYDPVIGKYSALTLRLVRIGGVLTVLLLAGFVIWMLRREKRSARHDREVHA